MKICNFRTMTDHVSLHFQKKKWNLHSFHQFMMDSHELGLIGHFLDFFGHFVDNGPGSNTQPDPPINGVHYLFFSVFLYTIFEIGVKIGYFFRPRDCESQKMATPMGYPRSGIFLVFFWEKITAPLARAGPLILGYRCQLTTFFSSFFFAFS